MQEAKTLLATQPLRVAIEESNLAALMSAIATAKGEADADGAVIEVSGASILKL